jgi:hypothetical protein
MASSFYGVRVEARTDPRVVGSGAGSRPVVRLRHDSAPWRLDAECGSRRARAAGPYGAVDGSRDCARTARCGRPTDSPRAATALGAGCRLLRVSRHPRSHARTPAAPSQLCAGAGFRPIGPPPRVRQHTTPLRSRLIHASGTLPAALHRDSPQPCCGAASRNVGGSKSCPASSTPHCRRRPARERMA